MGTKKRQRYTIVRLVLDVWAEKGKRYIRLLLLDRQQMRLIGFSAMRTQRQLTHQHLNEYKYKYNNRNNNNRNNSNQNRRQQSCSC